MGAKKELYSFVDKLKKQHGISDLPQDRSKTLCRDIFGIKVDQMPIVTTGLRGMAAPAANGKPAVIILNSSRTASEQNFDCMHEAIHIFKHADKNKASFSCYDKVRPKQNPFLEWEANEGSAEFIMPYRVFIPEVVKGIAFIEGDHISVPPEEILKLEQLFYATNQMIELRIQNLKYEIFQYLSGVHIDQLDIRSLREQEKSGVSYSSFCIDPSFDIRRFGNHHIIGVQ